MITNKERVEKLIEQIKRLETLTEEIRERDIYPVSFFSLAFDITNKIQEDLQQIEIYQIELFETQKKEHQAHILSTVRQPVYTENPEDTEPAVQEPPAQQEQKQVATPVYFNKPTEPIEPAIKLQPVYSTGGKNLIDLKKMITLNDRFLFCRELFANNEHLINQTISELNKEESYDASIDYLTKHFHWDFEDEHVVDFTTILKKRFS